MVMKKTFWVSAILAMLLVIGSYESDYQFRPVSQISSAALEMAGLSIEAGGTSYLAISMMTQYFILVTVFYFFLRSIAKSFTS